MLAFLKALKRRHIYQVAAVYAAVGLGLLGAAELVLDPLGLGAARPFIVVVTLVGFPIALVLAWAYEITPDGMTRTSAPAVRQEDEDLLAPPEFDEASLAVLPFVNVSPDPENEYFADGLTEEVIADLSHVEAIRVISRTSAMQFKGARKDVKTIGRELGVRYILEGSVRKAGDDLRITAQLIDARTDVHLWTHKHDGDLKDVFRVQEEVATSIAEALRVELSPAEKAGLTHRPVADARAYSLYLRARGEYGRQTKESLERAIDHLTSALSVVGDNSTLYTALGQTHFLYGALVLGADVHHEHLERAEECARKAMELEPESPRAHGLLGIVLYDRFETEEGLRHMKQAADLDPDDVYNLEWAVLAFSMCAKDEEAAAWSERLVEADPLNAQTQFIVGEHHLIAGRFDEAEDHFRRAYDLQPEGPNTRTSYAQVLAYRGEAKRAVQILDLPADAVSTNLVWDMIGQAMRYALAGDMDQARRFLTDELRDDARTDMLFSWLLAECYALLGDREEAVRWVRNAVDGGFLNPPFFSEIDPFLDPIREDPGFQELMVHLEERWAALNV